MAKAKVKSKEVFERKEKKYLLTQAKYEELLKRLKVFLDIDQYGLHTIHTIYYDTQNLDVIRHSVDEPKFKEKLRLRSYGLAADNSQVFLELKKKVAGITYKRRVALTYQEAKNFLDFGVKPSWTNQIFKEIEWYTKQHQLEPKTLISYDRLALKGKEHENFRITFDHQIRYSLTNFDLTAVNESEQTLLMSQPLILMEVKIFEAFPLTISRLFSELDIFQNKFTKYGNVYHWVLFPEWEGNNGAGLLNLSHTNQSFNKESRCMFNSLINNSSTQITFQKILLLIFISLFLGLMIALVHKFRNTYSKNFLFTVALLPTLVSSVIMVVNGNLGAGITVAGAFSLVRFRSAPGNAREITTIFFAMAVGLALGMGYFVYAGIFTVIVSLAMIIYTAYKFGDALENVRHVRITVPEYTNYMQEFDGVMGEFAHYYRLDRIKTTNLGSLCEVSFTVHEKNPYREKEFLDALRLINSNLPIIIQPAESGKEEL